MTPLQTLVAAGIKHKGQKAKEGERQRRNMRGLKEPFVQDEIGHI